MRTQEIQGEDKELARGAIAARVAVATDTAARAVCTSTSRAASDSGHLTRCRRFGPLGSSSAAAIRRFGSGSAGRRRTPCWASWAAPSPSPSATSAKVACGRSSAGFRRLSLPVALFHFVVVLFPLNLGMFEVLSCFGKN